MPDMHAPDAAPDIPDISEALDVRPMPHTQALALKRRVAESAMCAILKSKK